MLKISDRVQKTMADSGLLVMRVTLAVVFMYHGSQKLFGLFGGSGIDGFAGFLASLGIPLPTLNAYLAGGAEFFGGLLLLIGVGARLASVPLTVTMLVAAYAMGTGGMEYPLVLAFIVAGLGLIGPGRFTLGNACCSLRQTTPQANAA